MKSFNEILREAKLKDILLFDVADEMTVKELAKKGCNGYIGRSRTDNIDNPSEIRWVWYGGDHADERYGGSCYDFFECQDCDDFGNIDKTKVTKKIDGKEKKVPKTHYLHNVEADEVILFVRGKYETQYDDYGNVKYKGRGANKTSIEKFMGPGGEPGAFERRKAKREEKRLADEKNQRWKDRGTLYSPWMNHWKTLDDNPEFKKMLNDYRNPRAGNVSYDDLIAVAKTEGIDLDELDQYLSEAREAYSQALSHHMMYGG